MGVFGDISDFVSTGGGLLSFGDNIAGLFGQSSDMRFQREMLEKQQQWQSEEAQKNRDFQKAQQEYQNQFNYDSAFDMFNAYNQYNDPSAQMSRLSSAGVNPWLAMGGSGSSGSAQSQPSMNGVSPASGSMPANPSIPNTENIATRFQGVATMLDALASADKQSEEANRIRTLLNDELKKLQSDTASVDIANERERIKNSYLPEKCRKELDKLAQDIEIGKVTKDEIDERIKEIQSRTNLNQQEAALVWKYGDRLKLAEIKVKESQAEANKAAAKSYEADATYKIALKKTEDLTREDKAAILSFEKQLKGIPLQTILKLDDKGKLSRDGSHEATLALYSAVQQAAALGYITEQQSAEALVAGPKAVASLLQSISGTVANVASALK